MRKEKLVKPSQWKERKKKTQREKERQEEKVKRSKQTKSSFMQKKRKKGMHISSCSYYGSLVGENVEKPVMTRLRRRKKSIKRKPKGTGLDISPKEVEIIVKNIMSQRWAQAGRGRGASLSLGIRERDCPNERRSKQPSWLCLKRSARKLVLPARCLSIAQESFLLRFLGRQWPSTFQPALLVFQIRFLFLERFLHVPVSVV